MTVESRSVLHAWADGSIIPAGHAVLLATTQGFHYGTAVFEGIRAYADPAGRRLHIFRLHDHLERLHRSANLLRIDLGLPLDEIAAAICELLRANGIARDTYIRPIAYKSAFAPGAQPGVRLAGVNSDLSITTSALGHYAPEAGLRCVISRWRRIGADALPPGAKITGRYVNNALAMDEAESVGADDALLLNSAGNLTEATTANIAIISGGMLITPPESAGILAGVTRRTVLETLAPALGIACGIRDLTQDDLFGADECFLTGTGVGIVPVTAVDGRPIGDGAAGETTRTLRDMYFRTVRGLLPTYRKWLTTVDFG